MSRMHKLKTHPEPYQAVLDKRKPYEIRKNDRGFVVGDVLHLCEWDPVTEVFSGRETYARVTYMTNGGEWGIPLDLCVLGIDARVSVGAFPAVR